MYRTVRWTALIALTLLSTAVHVDAQPVLRAESLGEPVRTARSWTTALSPNPQGGYNFITQFYNYGHEGAPQWVVLDLNHGTQTNIGLPGYAIDVHGGYKGQLRAANGRIFLPVAGARMYYYEPAEQTIKSLGELFPPAKPGERGPQAFYRSMIGPDGKLYATTQANDGYTYLLVVNPDTLDYQLFDKIGSGERTELLTYGYWFSVDGPWVYISIGQTDWELVALNTDTGERRSLATARSPGIISFNNRPEGTRATVATEFTGEVPAEPEGHVLYSPQAKKKSAYFWCVDGELVPAVLSQGAANLPFTPRNQIEPEQVPLVQTTALPMGEAPQLDLSGLDALDDSGSFHIRWRPAGSEDESAWQAVPVQVDNTVAVNIESLTALPDGNLLGNGQQYSGFFRYLPETSAFEYYGKHGPSRPATTVADGKVYIAGYPSSHLWVFDPAEPWTSTAALQNQPDAGVNPRMLGNFADSGAHYAYYLIPHENGRIYFAGRRERAGRGVGVGYFDMVAQTFAGHHESLDHMLPRGFAVLPEVERLVLSGELYEKTGEAQLIVFDLDLKEVERLTVRPGLTHTGQLFPGAKPGQVIGNIDEAQGTAIYLYDITQRRVVQWRDLPSPIERITPDPDGGQYWAWAGGHLARLNPETLELTPVGKLDWTPGKMVWQNGQLYVTRGGELLRIHLPR